VHDVPDDVLHRFAEHARETAALAVAFHGRAAERLGLSTTDHRCLDLVARADGPVTAGRIAELSGLSTGAVTGVIDRLEGAGYVRRVRDPHDRRKVLVEVSDSGRTTPAALFGDVLDTLAAVLSRFTPEERDVVERYERALIEEFRGRAAGS
jgi:DNA-binding MarR family transcriptional regulator